MNNIDIEESYNDKVFEDLSVTPSRFRGLVYHKYTLYFITVLSVIMFAVQIHILSWILESKYQIDNNISIMRMLDIGQGDSFIIEHYSGLRFIIDTGSHTHLFMSQLFQEDCCLINYHKIRKTIDVLLLTHDDADHAAALAPLPSDIKIGTIITSPFTYSYIEKYLQSKSASSKSRSEPNIIPATNGFSFTILSDTFEIIFPNIDNSTSTQRRTESYDEKKESIKSIYDSPHTPSLPSRRPENDDSIIMKTKLHNTTILFTGDAGFTPEFEILKNIQTKKSIEHIDILKVGHHGSKYSTSKELLEATKPKYALISVGKKNTYGHPHKSVLKRLASAGIKKENIFRTDTCGQVQFTIYKMGAIGHPDCKSISYDNKGLD